MIGSIIRAILDVCVVAESCVERRCSLDGMEDLAPAGWMSFMAIWWTLDAGFAISDFLSGREADNVIILIDVLMLFSSFPLFLRCRKFLKFSKEGRK